MKLKSMEPLKSVGCILEPEFCVLRPVFGDGKIDFDNPMFISEGFMEDENLGDFFEFMSKEDRLILTISLTELKLKGLYKELREVRS